jgi:hypothetical protein
VEDDLQAWAVATATVPLSDNVVLWLEAQTRFSDDAGRLGQLLLRPGIGLRIAPGTTLFGGYAFVRTDPIGPARTHEHRIWQQLSFGIAGDGKGVTVTGRSRFEERLMEGSSDMGFRVRQLIRVTAPVGKGVRAVGWHESFVTLDDTRWGQRSGFDRMRNFAGIAVPVAKGMSIEPGYMNEYVRRRGPDRMNHIASITLNTSF